MKLNILLNFLTLVIITSCKADIDAGKKKLSYYTNATTKPDTFINKQPLGYYVKQNLSNKLVFIAVGNTPPNKVVEFAQTLIGKPYVYGSTNPIIGFDCSGFITYIFNHFNIGVPRSSSQFINVGKTISHLDAKPGDLILFTSPGLDNSNSRTVGHMGLVISNIDGTIIFIHSTSGKAMGVTQTPLNVHYQKRFLRIARIFLS